MGDFLYCTVVFKLSIGGEWVNVIGLEVESGCDAIG